MKSSSIGLIASALMSMVHAGEHPCGECHPAEARSQPGTSMAMALQRAADSLILQRHPSMRLANGAFTYSLRREGETVKYTVEGRGGSFTTAIPWAFGLGSAGQTYLYEREGAWYEARVSFYSAIQGLDITIGHRTLPAESIQEAAGRRLQKSEAVRCFGCHAGGTLDAVVPGVRCERCHEHAAEHARNMTSRTIPHTQPEPLAKYDAEQMADFCGGCHRTWQEIAANGPHDINNVRLQPYRLVSSKCYEGSLMDKRLSCVACHDPHHEVESSVRFYDAACVSCHRPDQPGVRQCSKENRDCVGCHMPKVSLPEAHFSFTDHRIRVVRAGESYPN